MPNPPHARTLDQDLVLDLCKKFNGYDGVVKYLREAGITNPRTGKPYSKMGVSKAAHRAKGYEKWRKDQARDLAASQKKFERVAKKALGGKAK